MIFRTMTVGDILEGFTDNMSEEQIDIELKLYEKIAWELLRRANDYASLGVIIDEDHAVDKDLFSHIESRIGYRPWCEDNKASGFTFVYFKCLDDAEKAEEYITEYLEEQEE